MSLLLAMNLAPQLLFARRFIPASPVELWAKIAEGTSFQRRVMAELAAQPGSRFLDRAPVYTDSVFPQALAALYRVRSLGGYSALQPQTYVHMSAADRALMEPWPATLIFEATGLSREARLRTAPRGTPTRFQFTQSTTEGAAIATDGGFTVSEPALDRVILESPHPFTGKLWWTDTRYPGWTATVDGQPAELIAATPLGSSITLTAARKVVLRYQPTYMQLALRGSALGVLLTLLVVGYGAIAWKGEREH
jgi:hypothetical protein